MTSNATGRTSAKCPHGTTAGTAAAPADPRTSHGGRRPVTGTPQEFHYPAAPLHEWCRTAGIVIYRTLGPRGPLPRYYYRDEYTRLGAERLCAELGADPADIWAGWDVRHVELPRADEVDGGRWRDHAACRDSNPALFHPHDIGGPAPIPDECGRCPVARQCGEYGRRNRCLGVWGGRYYGYAQKPVGPAHGTVQAWRLHRALGEQPCRACRNAVRAAS